jgi:membrane-associated phospholipid phosphatase
MNLDHTLSHAIYHTTRRSWLWRPLAIFGATSLLFVMITALIFTCHPVECDAELGRRLWGTTVSLAIPLFVTWAVVVLCQRFFHRSRPFNEGYEPLIQMVWMAPSFPSAHAAIAFATAAVSFWSSPELFGPWLFVAAACVAMSRVAVGVHFVSDVIMGALIGFFVGSATWYALMWFTWLSPWGALAV